MHDLKVYSNLLQKDKNSSLDSFVQKAGRPIPRLFKRAELAAVIYKSSTNVGVDARRSKPLFRHAHRVVPWLQIDSESR